MARIGGRNLWLAWPAGLLCAGVVAGLVWLAAPGVPGVVTWMGDTLRAATAPPQAAPDAPVSGLATDPDAPLDCRKLYPDALWVQLAWDRAVLLDQSHELAPTAVTALVDTLQPAVRVTCTWHGPRGAIISTLAGVGADAAGVAEAALRGEGFECAVIGDGVSCRRTQGDVREEHFVQGALWLATVETSWHPDDYGMLLAAHVWG